MTSPTWVYNLARSQCVPHGWEVVCKKGESISPMVWGDGHKRRSEGDRISPINSPQWKADTLNPSVAVAHFLWLFKCEESGSGDEYMLLQRNLPSDVSLKRQIICSSRGDLILNDLEAPSSATSGLVWHHSSCENNYHISTTDPPVHHTVGEDMSPFTSQLNIVLLLVRFKK